MRPLILITKLGEAYWLASRLSLAVFQVPAVLLDNTSQRSSHSTNILSRTFKKSILPSKAVILKLKSLILSLAKHHNLGSHKISPDFTVPKFHEVPNSGAQMLHNLDSIILDLTRFC